VSFQWRNQFHDACSFRRRAESPQPNIEALVSVSSNETEKLMTVTKHSSMWLLVCALPGAACGGGAADPTPDPVNAALAGSVSARVVCGAANENRALSIACPAGRTITSVDFASYGTPTGSCGALVEGACKATNSAPLLSNACLGKASCTVSASNAAFGDPCPGTLKRLVAQVTCTGTVSTPTTGICATAAENGTATLSCPAGKTITSVTYASYGTPSGSCGSFADGSCKASSSVALVSNACVGKASCTVAANNATFGDPCAGVVKRLNVQAVCGASSSGGSTTGSGADAGVVPPGTSGAGGAGGSAGSTGVGTDGGSAGSTGIGGKAGAGGAGGSTGTGSGGTGGATGGTPGAGGSGGGAPGGTARPSWNTGKGFFASGSKIYDANGVEFLMKGTNHTHWWGGTNEQAIPYMSNANANAVRAVFGPTGGADTPALRESIVRQYIAQRIVPVVDYHNATCDENPASLNVAVDLWVGADKAWLQSLERYVILNITNEWGPNSIVWRDAYKAAVARLRQAGVKNLLMIDAGGACGQLAESVEAWGREVFDSDPEKNIIFSIHQYGFWVDPGSPLVGTWDGRQPYDIDAEFTRLEATGLPIVVGEFSWSAFNQVTYTTRAALVSYTKHGIGWLSWMWNNPSDGSVNMANTNVYNTRAPI